MQDLLVSRDLGRLLTDFHAKGKITALVCHGPIALMSALNEPTQFAAQLDAGGRSRPGAWIYAGYDFTVISNEEERLAKPLLQGGEMKFYPQTALEQAGGRFQQQCNTVDAACRDRPRGDHRPESGFRFAGGKGDPQAAEIRDVCIS